MDMEKAYVSASPEETEAVAAELAKEVSAGSIYTLSGDLGAGKTVFAKGFAKLKNSMTQVFLIIFQGAGSASLNGLKGLRKLYRSHISAL